MEIDWWTLAIQTVNFLVVVWLLSRFLYRPVRRMIEAREADDRKAAEDAAAKAAEAERLFEEAGRLMGEGDFSGSVDLSARADTAALRAWCLTGNGRGNRIGWLRGGCFRVSGGGIGTAPK